MPTIWVPIEPSRCCVRARRVEDDVEEAATGVARDPRREGDRRDRRDERPQEVVDVAAQEDAGVGEAALAEPERDEQFLRIGLEQLLELFGILDHIRIEDGNEPRVSGGDHDEPCEQGAAAAQVERERRADHRPMSVVSSASTSSAFIGSSRS